MSNIIKPQESFYHHINQDWLDSNSIPPGYSRWSRFNELSDNTLHQLKELLPNVMDLRITKLKDFFENYNVERERKFINKLLEEIDECSNIDDLFILYQKKLNPFGVDFLYSFNVESDMKNSNFNVLYLGASGLTLPGRDYYLEDQFKEKRDKYLEFLQKFTRFYNLDVNNILEFETHLAKLHLPPDEKRNPDNVYFPTTSEKVRVDYRLPIETYFEMAGKRNINETDKIISTNEKYFESYLDNPILDVKIIDVLKSYLKFKTALAFSKTSQGELYELIFDFFGRTLSGQSEKLPQWKRTINLINVTLGELLGKEYVRRHFSEKAKNQVSEMISYFKEVLEEMIQKNTWMESQTKTKALEKLDKINWKIGYPEKWKDMSSLSLDGINSLSACLAKISEWWFYDEVRELYQQTDLSKWEMLPHQVNAYYHPLLNEIVFPAAILQPPFFSLDFTLPQNYGGIGVVIAHEITHGFDDQGKRFDADGNLNNWWTEKDEKQFQTEACKLEKQFDNLELYDTKLNGKLTLGENLADLGGVRISLAALTKKLDSLTLNQQKEFFESFARIWANLCSYEEGQKLIKIDPHSPGEYRVNGILPHLDEFHQTYQIGGEDRMFLKQENRCRIWTL